MRTELKDALRTDFPHFYQSNESLRQNGYFAVGDGWEPIIRKLSEKILTEYLTWPSEQQALFQVVQIKEKFGGLRYYYDGEHTEAINQAIHDAETASYCTCELCGAPGERVNVTGWIQTLCHACYVKQMLAKGYKLIICGVCAKSDVCMSITPNYEWLTDLPNGWYVANDPSCDNDVKFVCSKKCAEERKS